MSPPKCTYLVEFTTISRTYQNGWDTFGLAANHQRVWGIVRSAAGDIGSPHKIYLGSTNIIFYESGNIGRTGINDILCTLVFIS